MGMIERIATEVRALFDSDVAKHQLFEQALEKVFAEQLGRPLDPYKAVDDGLITSADLKRHLPAKLPFHGHTLKRGSIVCALHPVYLVTYRCDQFFDCESVPRPSVEVFSRWGERPDGSEVLVVTETTSPPKKHLEGVMTFKRFPAQQLPDILRNQLRIMYWRLEAHIKKAATNGWSVRRRRTN